jgi:hypothetical protein
VTDSAEWDALIAAAGSHPLQSALWGDARREADGIVDLRLARSNPGGTATLVRMELRSIPLLGGRVGWIPRGPAGTNIDKSLLVHIGEANGRMPFVVVTDSWREGATDVPSEPTGAPETIWVDLAPGKAELWGNLDKRVRYAIQRARKAKVVFERSRAPQDRDDFFALLEKISGSKGFDLPISKGLVDRLLSASEETPVAAHLFVARIEGSLAAAALMLKCGTSIHYLAGGTDRRFAKEQVGEALQWTTIEWAIDNGATLYDMEGIDRAQNPGTYAFKKKMGGREVALLGKQYYAPSLTGRALVALDRLRDRFR